MVDCLNKMMPLRRDEDVNFAGGLSGEDFYRIASNGKRSLEAFMEKKRLKIATFV